MIKYINEKIKFWHWKSIHSKSLKVINAWQAAKLRSLVQHVKSNVPMYRKLYYAISSGDSVNELPLISKEYFLTYHYEEFINHANPLKPHWYKTSGTSGVPFSFIGSNLYLLPNYRLYLIYRFLFWLGMSQVKIEEMKAVRIRVRKGKHKNTLSVLVSDFLENTGSTVRAMISFGPDIVEAYPSMLLRLCEYLIEHPEVSFQVRFAVSIGEVLTGPQRKFIEETLKCEVYNRYGLEELGAVGVECRFHDGFHLHSESYIVEIMDEENNPVYQNTRGRVVITDLYNYNMPFIRYDTGDIGSMIYEPCRCGLKTPRLFIEGRFSAYLKFGGREIHHLEFDAELDGYHGVLLKYQVVKMADDFVRVLVIPGQSFNNFIADEITDRMRKLLGDKVRIAVEPVSSTLYTPAGKTKIVVDLSA